jgi:hypothetical protein
MEHVFWKRVVEAEPCYVHMQAVCMVFLYIYDVVVRVPFVKPAKRNATPIFREEAQHRLSIDVEGETLRDSHSLLFVFHLLLFV